MAVMGRPNQSGPGKYIELGLRAKKAFENAGYGDESLEKQADRIDLTAGALGKLYNGHNAAAYSTLIAICKVTNVNFEWLSTGRGPMIYSLTGSTIDISAVPVEKREALRNIVNEFIRSCNVES
jgi:phage repressor protein C with HTH and peptisase S24 domain